MNLFISDIDGTLINGERALTPFAREALTAMLREGLPFTIASARSLITLREILGDLPLRLPIIEANGAFISDWETGRHLVTQAMDGAAAAGVWDVMQAQGHALITLAFDGAADRIYFPPPENPGMAQYYAEREAAGDRRMTPHDAAQMPRDEQIIMFVAVERRTRLEQTEKILEHEFGAAIHMHLMENLYHSEWNWLTVHDPRATKGHAVRILRERFTPTAQRVTVFGDHSNDVSLFEAADHRVAMGNATDDLKRQADEIIGANTDDAVAKYLMAQWVNSNHGNGR